MTITDNLLTITGGRPKTPLKPEGVVVHYVGNAGSSALANRNFFNTAGANCASAHYVVGLNGEVIRCVPENEVANHAGKSYGAAWDATAATANKKYIGIENCHPDGSGKFAAVTYNALVELCADIFKRYGWGASEVETRLKRHYDVCGKDCPTYYVKNPSDWNVFREAVKVKLNGTATGATAAAPSGTTPTAQTSTAQTSAVQTSAINKLSIMGKPVLTAEQLTVLALSRNKSPKLNCTMSELAGFYLKLGELLGVRGDAAFCQALHETGCFAFGGQVPWTANNYCGLGAFNGTAKYATFSSPSDGVLAHLEHLFAYGSRNALPSGFKNLDPRFDDARALPLCASYDDLAGKWAKPGYDDAKYKDYTAAYAAGAAYGQTVKAYYDAAAATTAAGGIATGNMIPAAKSVTVGAKVTIKAGSVYGGAAKGKPIPAAQLAPKQHTVSKIQVNGGVQEALLAEIVSWAPVASLAVV